MEAGRPAATCVKRPRPYGKCSGGNWQAGRDGFGNDSLWRRLRGRGWCFGFLRRDKCYVSRAAAPAVVVSERDRHTDKEFSDLPYYLLD